MPTHSDRRRARLSANSARTAILALALALTPTLCACGSASRSGASTAAIRRACTQLSAVLSDGPDPDADPVGHAEAQILPLGQFHAPDKALAVAVSQLAAAYRQFFDSNGTGAAKKAVAAASKKINSFCPGAAA
jgi:hypothetical protein